MLGFIFNSVGKDGWWGNERRFMWGGGGVRGQRGLQSRLSEKGFQAYIHIRKNMSSQAASIILVFWGGTLVSGASTIWTRRWDACALLRGRLTPTSSQDRLNFCMCSKLPLHRAASLIRLHTWCATDGLKTAISIERDLAGAVGVPNCGTYLLAVMLFISQDAAVLPKAGTGNLIIIMK